MRNAAAITTLRRLYVIGTLVLLVALADVYAGPPQARVFGVFVGLSAAIIIGAVIWKTLRDLYIEAAGAEDRLTRTEQSLEQVEARNRLLEKAIGKLEEVERIKKNFLLMASHQMRSPLVAIQSVIKVIVSGAITGDDEAVRNLLGQAYNRSEDMLGMVNDILNLAEAKVERDEGAEETDAAAELDAVVSLLRPVGAERRVEITLAAEPDMPRVRIVRKSLNHIFTNLVENAVKYSRDNSAVSVALSLETDSAHDADDDEDAAPRIEDMTLRLEVADQGIGIPEDAQGKIFKEFFRADNAREIQKQGTGLGLAIVKEIIDNLGGAIAFESKENQGTKFTVTLPFVPKPPAEEKAV